jgi:uncharacterized membrane protein
MNLWDYVSNIAAVCVGLIIIAVTVMVIVSMMRNPPPRR